MPNSLPPRHVFFAWSGAGTTRMALYLLQGENLKALELSTLEGEGISERGDLQQLLMDHPDVMADGLLIVADEFSQ